MTAPTRLSEHESIVELLALIASIAVCAAIMTVAIGATSTGITPIPG